MRRRQTHDETGSVLVIAMILMAMMVALGLASFSFVDTGQRRAREQRERETALNLAEGVLASQGFALGQAWPASAALAASMPASCTSAAVRSGCPDPNALAAGNSSAPASASFANVDASAAVSWTTTIRDNGGPLAGAYASSRADEAQSGTSLASGLAYTCAATCSWDANGDLQMWIQARAVVRGRPRSIVALLKREQFPETFGANIAITAGSVEVTNAGSKTIINATTSQVVVRCTGTGIACTDYDPAKPQILPTVVAHDPNAPPGMSAAQRERFKVAAMSADPPTYYTSCPASLAGRTVYIDVPSATHCADTGNGAIDSAAAPGMIIMPRGTLTLSGRLNGVLYLANGQDSSGPVLTLAANSEVAGGIAIDGQGRLVVGQSSGSRTTMTYVPTAFDGLATYSSTGLVQNTWRELSAN
ncbi:MAG: hypothetical protein QOJ35_2052 [Solirubrobacteraceae bacterium]|jgi:Tfp pilus assembly protein PilX|nr:hypothetical protein [Solirubrobacteraceae bacterium]